MVSMIALSLLGCVELLLYEVEHLDWSGTSPFLRGVVVK